MNSKFGSRDIPSNLKYKGDSLSNSMVNTPLGLKI